MNRITKSFSTRAMIAPAILIGMAVLLLSYQTIVKGKGGDSSPAAQSQDYFNNGDNFIFTNASLKGVYAGVLDCTLAAGPVTGPCAVSYLYTADGNGNITTTDATVNNNGQSFLNINFPGTYTVSVNGRVTMNVTPINGPLTGVPLSFNSVVTETSGGQITELRGVLTTPGIVATGVEKRIRK
ncbi:MAG: hypothetical protein AB7U82_31045 [Blastocatellales bacterium]